jgi:hypothetical protein
MTAARSFVELKLSWRIMGAKSKFHFYLVAKIGTVVSRGQLAQTMCVILDIFISAVRRMGF